MKVRKTKYENQKTAETDLLERIKPFLASYRKRRDKALSNALNEIELDAVHTETLSMDFGEIFGDDDILWIEEPTTAGNDVPLHVMAAAYAIWKDARRFAYKLGLDGVDAAEALTKVVHLIADRLAGSNAPVIRNIQNYMFMCYARVLKRVAARYVGSQRRQLKTQMSDNGKFLAALENVILCDEILSEMPPQLREMVRSKYKLGYSFEELAAAAGSTNSAVRKAVNSGIRKTFAGTKQGKRKSKK